MSITADRSFVFEIRAAAMKCPDAEKRARARLVADEISWTLQQFARAPTHFNLRMVNGAWARGSRIYSDLTEAPDPTSTGGRMPLPEKLAA